MNTHMDALLLRCLNIFHTSAYYGIHKSNISRIQCFKLNSIWIYTPSKTNMTMEKQPFEDVPAIKNAQFPMSC